MLRCRPRQVSVAEFADSLIETFAERFGFQASARQKLLVEYEGDIHWTIYVVGCLPSYRRD
jgi:hypothetical protein